MDCSPTADYGFGPRVPTCLRGFDFTILFEETILSVLPSGIFLILACCRILVLLRAKRKTRTSFLYASKMLAIITYSSLQMALLVEKCRPFVFKTPYTVPAASMSLASATIILGLSHFEHRKALRPSPLLSIYLFFTLPFDVARTRTLWLSMQTENVCVLFSAGLAMKVLILCLENMSKSPYLRTKDQTESPEETAGIFGLSFFTWLLPLMRDGYRKVLTVDDLYPTDSKMSSGRLWARFRGEWNKRLSHSLRETKSRALIWITFITLNTAVLTPIIPRLCLTAFTFTQPFLVKRVIKFLEEGDKEDVFIGYSLLAAYGIVYMGIAVSTSWYWRFTYRWVTMMRGCLVTMIYDKTLELKSTEDHEKHAMTLMSNDVQRVVRGMRNFHEIWASILESGLAMWLLYSEIGLAFVAVVGVFLVCTIFILQISKHTGERQRVWIHATQKRVNAAANMLGSIKAVKMLGAEVQLQDFIQSLRDQEVNISKAYRNLTAASAVLSYTTSIIAPVLVFSAFTAIARRDHETLDTSRMFTSLTLISLLGAPLVELFQAFPIFIAALACFQRIQVFLETDSRNDYRLFSTEERTPNLGSWTSDQPKTAIELSDNPTGAEHAIIIHHASFGYLLDKVAIIQDIDLQVTRGGFLAVIGAVGSGKSLLLKALLGEVPKLGGTVVLYSTKIGYCDQTPWLANTTIRQNIMGTLDFDETWYSSVLHACAMDADIERLPEGDSYCVGTGGVNLSGGQKQRVALARAVYARKDILILDHVFSGIDKDTEKTIFDRLWGSNGIFRRLKTTVVLVTHAAHQLRGCDQIVALGVRGKPLEQGTFAELVAANGYVTTLCNEPGKNSQDSNWNNDDLVIMDVKEEVPMPSSSPTKAIATIDDFHQAKDTAIYKYYFKSIGMQDACAFLCGAIVFAVLFKFPDIWVMWWSNQNNVTPSQNVGYWLGIYSLIQVLAILSFSASIWHLTSRLTTVSGKNLHRWLLDVVLAAPFQFISCIDTGVITNRFSQDMQMVDSSLPYSLFNTLTEGFTCIMQLALVAVANAFIVAGYPVILGACYFIQRFYLRTSKQLRVLELEAKSPLYTQFLETMNGISTVRAFSWEASFRQKNHLLLDSSQRPFYVLYCVQTWLGLVLDLTVAGLAIVTVGLAIGLKGKTTPGSIGVALLNITTLGSTLKVVILSWTSLEVSMGAISRLESFCRETPCENLPDETKEPPAGWPNMGNVDFNGVTSSYRQDGVLALDGISVSIKSGQKIAIRGRTGSGKTSFILAIFRMIELSKGTIIIDGIDISTIPRHIIRSRLSTVTQDSYCFPGTFRVNLDPASLAQEERIVMILQELEIWEKIEEEGGLDAGMCLDTFSHGQKQLFCLARAILKPGKILVLDEAMSSVDAATHKTMERMISQELEAYTIIVITHRLNSAIDYDQIIVLENGRKVEWDDTAV